MTDRINSVVVILDRDIRDDDIEPTLNALRMVKGVLTVKPHVDQGLDAIVAEHRIKREVYQSLIELAQDLMS